MQNRNTVLDCLYLFNKSDDHRLYTLAEFNSYCLFPLLHKKARLFYDGDQPVGFVSWAWLTEEEAQEFLSERWMPDEEVWKRPDVIDDQYQLWGIDFIAPFGHSTKVMRGMMKHSQSVLGKRIPAHWRRFKQPDKVHTKEF
jgi:cytolysin-activating lysine-acyltransferase